MSKTDFAETNACIDDAVTSPKGTLNITSTVIVPDKKYCSLYAHCHGNTTGSIPTRLALVILSI